MKKKPNKELLKAIEEVEEMEKHPENAKTWTDLDEFMKDLTSEEGA